MWTFFVICLAAGIALLVMAHKLKLATQRAAAWPQAVATLENCEVVERPGMRVEDTSTTQLQVRYSYVVGGRTYRSDRYAYGYDTRDIERLRRVAAGLRECPELLVHYDPAQPSEAVIDTTLDPQVAKLGYVGLGLAGLSMLIALFQCT